MEGGRGSGGPASHTRTFPDLVPPRGQNLGSVLSDHMLDFNFDAELPQQPNACNAFLRPPMRVPEAKSHPKERDLITTIPH